MKKLLIAEKLNIGYHVIMASLAALIVALMAALPNPAFAAEVTVPSVPPNIQVAKGNVAFLVGHATGTQNYICLPSGAGFAFKLFTPEATLFDDNGGQIITHFFSPNPVGAIRATWQYKDTSSVWAEVKTPPDTGIPDSSTDPNFVKKGAVAWLKLTQVGVAKGPTGGDKLSNVTFVQRINTDGGLAPATGCSSPADVGTQAFMPYTADYFFYHAANN